jgi:hypothetical protein
MSHYVIIDGVLQKSTTDTKRWASRAAKAQPSATEEPRDAVALPEDRRTDYEIIEGLEEHDGV